MKKKKPNLKKRYWDLFSKYIRLKYADDEGYSQCITCKKRLHWKQLQAGHYVPKVRGLSIYFEERNVHPQCVGCNVFKKGEMDKYAIEMVKMYGQGILEALDEQSRHIIKISPAEYKERIVELTVKLKDLEEKDFIFGGR